MDSSTALYNLLKVEPFFLLACPNVIESEEHLMRMAKHIKSISTKVGLLLVFKSSSVKAKYNILKIILWSRHDRRDRAPAISRRHTSCPLYWWNPEEFLGPAALLHAYRWICDSRDEFTEERLQASTEDERRLYRRRAIKSCAETCPKSLNPAVAIHKMKTKHLLSLPMEKVENM